MGQKQNPRVGVIADSTLQRHVVCKAIEAAGYDVALTLPPEKVDDGVIGDSHTDVWLVDIEDEDRWSDFIVHLFEAATAPILLGEGNAPSVNSLQFQRWERKIYAKLKDIVGAPVPPPLDLAALVQPRAAPLPLPPQLEGRQHAGEPASNIWVLGASLGGPNAVKEFLDALPAGLPVAFLIAQHIDAGFEDTLTKVWSRNSAFSFVKPLLGNRLGHGQIMIAPIEQVMCLTRDAEVMLFDEPWEGPYAPSIDQVMALMADNLGQQTGAILFSGMGNDGAIAAVRMRDMNIPVWAQTADTCANSSMPDSARATGCVSFSGSPLQLAQQFTRHAAEHFVDILNI